MTHEEVQKVLPWYANHRLDAEESRRVEAHLTACAICRGDVEGLTAMLAAHEKSLPERPVNEARLDALFERIDRHDAERRRGHSRGETVPWWQWFTMRPALAAGSLAAVLLAVFMAPGLFETQQSAQEFSVLSQKGGEIAPFVVRVRFNTVPARDDAERSIASSIRQMPSLPAYRVEQRSSAEYAIVFESKPSVEAVGQLLTQLGGVANVASTAVDDGADATRN
jgi:hypothetical protein